MTNPDDIQIGGDHYKKLSPQPWEVMEGWGPREHFIGFLRFNILKRLGRWDSKDSALQDAKKARHELDKLIEIMEVSEEVSLDVHNGQIRVNGGIGFIYGSTD